MEFKKGDRVKIVKNSGAGQLGEITEFRDNDAVWVKTDSGEYIAKYFTSIELIPQSYKCKVTPDQSRRLQEAAFKQGWTWGGDRVVMNTNRDHLYFNEDKIIGWTNISSDIFFREHENTLIDPEELIAKWGGEEPELETIHIDIDSTSDGPVFEYMGLPIDIRPDCPPNTMYFMNPDYFYFGNGEDGPLDTMGGISRSTYAGMCCTTTNGKGTSLTLKSMQEAINKLKGGTMGLSSIPAKIKRFLNANYKAFYQLGWVDKQLDLTNAGANELLNLLLDTYEEELGKIAKKRVTKIKEEQEK